MSESHFFVENENELLKKPQDLENQKLIKQPTSIDPELLKEMKEVSDLF